MRFRKAVVSISFLMVFVMFAAQSAKASTINSIIINDLGDTVMVEDPDNTGRVSLTSIGGPQACGVLNLEFCTFALNAPNNTSLDQTPGSSTNIPATYLLREPGTLGVPLSCGRAVAPQVLGCVSDGLASAPAALSGGTLLQQIQLMVHSDTTANGREVPVNVCPPTGCNTDENGTPQLIDVVQWTDGTIDNIYLESDAGVGSEPEPASLILFGSGLVMAGTFMRRRRVM
jgi:hypothetical protein